jgi:hypothetical protein
MVNDFKVPFEIDRLSKSSVAYLAVCTNPLAYIWPYTKMNCIDMKLQTGSCCKSLATYA